MRSRIGNAEIGLLSNLSKLDPSSFLLFSKLSLPQTKSNAIHHEVTPEWSNEWPWRAQLPSSGQVANEEAINDIAANLQ